MREILWISLGAIFGANLRYGIARLTGRLYPHPFPLGTLLINITGSFLLGVFFMWARTRLDLDPRWRLLIAVGFCGGYTTFSAFAWETMDLANQGRWGLAALNIAASNILGLAAVFAGAYMSQKIFTS
jgi:CrcB protein